MDTNYSPVVMDIDPKNGRINRFTELTPTESSILVQEMLGYTMNWHRTYGAIYNDNRDSIDGNDYTYVSYV